MFKSILKLIGLFIVLSSFCSCSESIDKGLGKGLKITTELFGEESIDHYPKYVSDFNTRFHFQQRPTNKSRGSDDFFCPSEAMFFTRYKDSNYKSIKKAYASFQTWRASDTSLIYIFPYTEDYKTLTEPHASQINPLVYEYVEVNKPQNAIPVPLIDIKGYYDMEHVDVKGFKHILLDSKAGKPDFDIHLYDAPWLPEKWKHGYSKGISFHDEMNVVVYWFIAW
ncbi:hypothetical protein [Carboxylicivirga sp. N1Y90]|uniref:hypothetical protein n=1 Tax=Carboxylicivirga fragile TaxID=3417571 RepID=UPI003D34FB6D|nr:hypothetical protein [Marinilabiliaceae bacterium N1Y90]